MRSRNKQHCIMYVQALSAKENNLVVYRRAITPQKRVLLNTAIEER